jgi:hypothetical protein
LQARDAILPEVLRSFPAESVFAACNVALDDSALSKRVKRALVRKTSTIYRVRTTTAVATRTVLSTATRLRTRASLRKGLQQSLIPLSVHPGHAQRRGDFDLHREKTYSDRLYAIAQPQWD